MSRVAVVTGMRHTATTGLNTPFTRLSVPTLVFIVFHSTSPNTSLSSSADVEAVQRMDQCEAMATTVS